MMSERLKSELREKYKDVRLVVGIPSGDMIHAQFAFGLISLITHNSQFLSINLTGAIGSRIARNRNAIVDNAVQMKGTHLLWLDSDGMVPNYAVLKLLQHDKDIVGAAACARTNSDHRPACVPLEGHSLKEKLVPMYTIGFQVMLMKLSVFDKMRKPYFAEVPHWAMGGAQDSDDLVGEDAYFCAMARDAGLTVWCDTELTKEIGHIGHKALYVDTRSMV